jgi:predicted nuclease of predicted toxin-antitoxin system
VTFLLDNDVPDAIGRVAAQEGHTVTRLREVLPPESDDSAVLRFAHSQESVLVTCNRDHFLALLADHPHAGLVVVIRRQSRVAECSRFLRLLRNAGESGIPNNVNFA